MVHVLGDVALDQPLDEGACEVCRGAQERELLPVNALEEVDGRCDGGFERCPHDRLVVLKGLGHLGAVHGLGRRLADIAVGPRAPQRRDDRSIRLGVGDLGCRWRRGQGPLEDAGELAEQLLQSGLHLLGDSREMVQQLVECLDVLLLGRAGGLVSGVGQCLGQAGVSFPGEREHGWRYLDLVPGADQGARDVVDQELAGVERVGVPDDIVEEVGLGQRFEA